MQTAVHARIPAEAEPPPDTHVLVRQLDKEGLTQTLIAQQVGLSQSQVSRILAKYDDTRELAKARTHNAALKLADAMVIGAIRAARKGDCDPVLELADRIGFAEKKQKESGGPLVQIIQGLQITA